MLSGDGGDGGNGDGNGMNNVERNLWRHVGRTLCTCAVHECTQQLFENSRTSSITIQSILSIFTKQKCILKRLCESSPWKTESKHQCNVDQNVYINALRARQNGRHFADDTFKRIFLKENVRISIKISLKFVPKGPIDNIPALFQMMAWRRPGDKPLSEAMMVRSRRIYASLGLNELTHWGQDKMVHILQTTFSNRLTQTDLILVNQQNDQTHFGAPSDQ